MSVSALGSINYSNSQYSQNTDLENVLFTYGNDKHHTPLWQAVNAEDFNAVNILLKNKFDPNELSWSGYALNAAIYKKNMTLVKTLLDHGADPFKPMQGNDIGPYSQSTFFILIERYCIHYTQYHLDHGDFCREVIEEIVSRKIKTDQICFTYKGKKYTPAQTCINLNVVKELHGNKDSLTEIQKQRGAKLASLFLTLE